ncbi:hypothetical protein E2986_13110 [Frieseomelitta varia]|uniref:Uncharacterized protein n=1 Tax=Frieseomelitta varia TaxID=561572 RepID=A0A833W0Y8_9HYME|nr:hypothetical protein E2986_13110 [Frieseomelitta varia]
MLNNNICTIICNFCREVSVLADTSRDQKRLLILGGSACALVLAISAAKGVCNTLETLLEFRSPTGDVKGPSLNIENEGVKTRKKHGKGEPTQFAKTSVSLRGALVHIPASVAMIIVVLTSLVRDVELTGRFLPRQPTFRSSLYALAGIRLLVSRMNRLSF